MLAADALRVMHGNTVHDKQGAKRKCRAGCARLQSCARPDRVRCKSGCRIRVPPALLPNAQGSHEQLPRPTRGMARSRSGRTPPRWTTMRGDIVTIGDRGGAFTGKPHPAIVRQSDAFLDAATVVVLPITGEAADAPLLRIPLQPGETTGLAVHSWAHRSV